MDPIDYTIKAQNPMTSFLGGLQGGVQIQGLQQQNQQRQMLAEAKAAEMAASEQKALAEAEELQRQAALESAISASTGPNFDATKLIDLSMRMPKDRAKAMQDAISLRSDEQQKNDLLEQTTLMSALVSGKLDVAREMISTKISTFINTPGKENEAKHMEAMLAGLEDDDPSDVIVGIGSIISQFKGGPEALEAIQKQQQGADTLREGRAKADIAEVDAKYAEQSKRLNLAKIESDISLAKERERLRAMEAVTARMNAGIARDTLLLEYENAKTDYKNKVLDRAAEAEAGQYGVASARQAVDDLKNHQGFSALFGAKVPYAASIPGSDAAGANALLDQLKAKVFVIGAQKMKGLGALGEKEGEKIEAEVAALNPNMSESDAKAALSRIGYSMNVLDKLHQKRYGVPPADTFRGAGESAETVIDTADEYNALPRGAVYVDKADGKKYRKP